MLVKRRNREPIQGERVSKPWTQEETTKLIQILADQASVRHSTEHMMILEIGEKLSMQSGRWMEVANHF